MVTKQTFWIVLLRLFLFKFRRFLSTVGFSNEDNCCLLQGIGKLIKEKLSKGIFKVDLNLLMSLEIQISSSLLLTSANKRRTFFTNRVLFGVIFFPKSCLKVLGAAYTRVRLIHESLRYLFYIIMNSLFISKYFNKTQKPAFCSAFARKKRSHLTRSIYSK